MWQFNRMLRMFQKTNPSKWLLFATNQQRLLFATKHVLSRWENSSQNLWYLKTSTSHTYKTDRKGYWQLFYTCDNSTEH